MANVIVLRHARLIDCTGRPPSEDAAVVIEDDRIREVDLSGRITYPPGASVIDCRGETLMPGLTDAHVHIMGVTGDMLSLHRQLPSSLIALKAGAILRQMLFQGFTTVRDCGGADLGMREAVAQGVIPGPRLLISGRFISQTGGHGDYRRRFEHCPPLCGCVGLLGSIADGVAEVRRAVREELRRGADQIKLMAGGGAASFGDEINNTQYTVAELRAGVEEAGAAGTYVCAHAYGPASIRNAVEAGVRSIEHGNLMSDDAAQAIKAADAFLVPTMVASVVISEEGARHGVGSETLRKIEHVKDAAVNSLAIAARLGLRIGSASDLFGPLTKYQALELELKAKVLSPMEVLVAATRTNAELFRLQDRIGTIESGKWADLLVVRGDPLRNLRLFQLPDANLLLIMKEGQIVKCLL